MIIRGEANITEPFSDAQCPVCKQYRASGFFTKNGYDIFQCSNCNFLFVHPYPDNEALAQHYEQTYRGATDTYYPKSGSRRWRGFWRSLKFIKYVMNKDVLDLGCGGGFMVEAFSRLGAKASGIDISQNSISYARTRWPHYNFYCEGLNDFRQRELTYDFVFSSEVLEHLPGPDEFMQTITAVTRPQGFVYISAPDAGHKSVPKDIRTWGDICPPEHLQWFNHQNLVTLFGQYGFQLHKDYGSSTPAHSVLFQKLT